MGMMPHQWAAHKNGAIKIQPVQILLCSDTLLRINLWPVMRQRQTTRPLPHQRRGGGLE